MKQIYHCAWCKSEVMRYACEVGKRVFCCPSCRSKFLSKEHNPNGYTQHPHLSHFNEENNQNRMTPAVKQKIREKRLCAGEAKTYKKILGRHEHRIIAELMLGRELEEDEVVHHIDGNRRNNDHKNLMIFKSQKDHAAFHQSENKKQGCKSREEVMPL